MMSQRALPMKSKVLSPPPDDAAKAALKRQAYKINEAAEILGVKPITVRRLIQKGHLRCSRLLRHLLIPAAELEKLFSANMTSPMKSGGREDTSNKNKRNPE